ncbi:alpha/beta fold hydrolase [Nioella nitratireducens]|uniref:alpha/beta fold hydrolase n=1 Tax=Nioella nitratireducens TaxID=1287720 RepID=UPI0008FD0BA2|nr:alpha/beta hydrolase [Nioella nitratireducens]
MSGFARHWGQDGDRPVLMLHCSLAHSGAWEGMVRALGPGLRITAPDILGHGRAPDIDLTKDLHDQCYEAILPHLPEGRFDAVGHSFGATLALRLAVDMPERIRSLILIEPVLFAAAKGSGALSAYRDQMATFDRLFSEGRIEDATREFLRLWGAGGGLDAMPEGQQRYMIDRIRFVAASNAALFEDSAGLVPRLAEVRGPVLLVDGAERLPITAAVLDRMAAKMPDTVRLTVEGAGHMVPITHPRPVAEALIRLLAQAA